MTSNRRLLVIVLSLALGLGVWAASFSYQAATFGDGDVLSAAVLNALLNDNFQAAADAVSALEAEVAALETALAEKYDAAGGHIAGQVSILADEDEPVLTIKQQGTGPVLQLLSGAGGTLIETADASGITFTLARDGVVTNAVGSGLPVAYGRVELGQRQAAASTSNWTVTTETDVYSDYYRITIDDVFFTPATYTFIATSDGVATAPRFAYFREDDGDVLVRIYQANASHVAGNFSFVVFRPGH